jgi:hypothetical protein
VENHLQPVRNQWVLDEYLPDLMPLSHTRCDGAPTDPVPSVVRSSIRAAIAICQQSTIWPDGDVVVQAITVQIRKDDLVASLISCTGTFVFVHVDRASAVRDDQEVGLAIACQISERDVRTAGANPSSDFACRNPIRDKTVFGSKIDVSGGGARLVDPDVVCATITVDIVELPKGRCTKSVYVSHAVRTWTLRTHLRRHRCHWRWSQVTTMSARRPYQ